MPMSSRRRVRTFAISAAATPAPASWTPSSARMPSPIDAPIESTTWISRSLNVAFATWAALIVPESESATWTETIASAPSSNAFW
jgi:hypothetical protein